MGWVTCWTDWLIGQNSWKLKDLSVWTVPPGIPLVICSLVFIVNKDAYGSHIYSGSQPGVESLDNSDNLWGPPSWCTFEVQRCVWLSTVCCYTVESQAAWAHPYNHVFITLLPISSLSAASHSSAVGCRTTWHFMCRWLPTPCWCFSSTLR